MLVCFGFRMQNVKFSIEKKLRSIRAGKLTTKYGEIKTPVFMPVGTLASVKAIFPKELENLGVEIILANTYHLMQRPGDELIKEMGGVQNFMSWNSETL